MRQFDQIKLVTQGAEIGSPEKKKTPQNIQISSQKQSSFQMDFIWTPTGQSVVERIP